MKRTTNRSQSRRAGRSVRTVATLSVSAGLLAINAGAAFAADIVHFSVINQSGYPLNISSYQLIEGNTLTTTDCSQYVPIQVPAGSTTDVCSLSVDSPAGGSLNQWIFTGDFQGVPTLTQQVVNDPDVGEVHVGDLYSTWPLTNPSLAKTSNGQYTVSWTIPADPGPPPSSDAFTGQGSNLGKALR